MTQLAFCRRMGAMNRFRKTGRLLALAWALSLAWSAAALAARPVLVFGDSLASAYGIAERRGWVALLENRLKQERLDYRVVNASISGETTRGGLARLEKLLGEHKPAIVILELGGNDGLRGLPVAEMKRNLGTMIEQSKDRKSTRLNSSHIQKSRMPSSA